MSGQATILARRRGNRRCRSTVNHLLLPDRLQWAIGCTECDAGRP